jgi:hypothetical protein
VAARAIVNTTAPSNATTSAISADWLTSHAMTVMATTTAASIR